MLRRRNLLRCDLQSDTVKIEPIELEREFLKRRIAARRDGVDDAACRRLDVGRSLALGGQKRPKRRNKVG